MADDSHQIFPRGDIFVRPETAADGNIDPEPRKIIGADHHAEVHLRLASRLALTPIGTSS